MRLSKRVAVVLAFAMATSGWFFGRGMGSQVQAEPTKKTLDPHVVVSATKLSHAIQVAPLPRRSNDVARVEHPLQAEEHETFHERDPNEWQGMLVDLSMRQICDQTTSCGLALSCNSDGKCGPCEVDNDCAGGESCVLDHCLPASQVECTSRNDCAHVGDDAYCVLSGLTGGEPRSNSKMRSYCQASTGGTTPKPSADDPRRQRHGDHVRPAFERTELLKELKDRLR